MSLYAFDINDVIDLNQTCENQSIDLNVNEDEWKLVRQQLLTPTPSVCDERPISRCESVMLFNRINDVGEDECIDLESNDLKEFLDTQSILLKDYSSSPMTHFTLKRRSFEENSSKPDSEQVRLMVNNPATEQTANKQTLCDRISKTIIGFNPRKKKEFIGHRWSTSSIGLSK
ncbi:hypothetical protein G6F57_003214 [Rhizopus arrhizus]|uniref:Uncharacterized protein n=1 Tax=Rhizopus oryzae TaxID=64495 RepID=A0A9P7BNZ5_RHIOR|nr:hypothetical protein G6F23_007764 [Rhizopus arrhizus]KAG1415920.1 hypothetical protein G6F58_006238 [Rhizopus delemar]KAG0764809.1 hypothetical protein G6F24_004921 [Rhizopus arrhizus]KAG0785194.1 hypothetical protein G6F21_009419 [Rhizopus arrhizus]KAG0789364.1 hypothetical protein G6F22_006731 [Rhizopus arrhizus]